jgi:hypothetical protein
MTHSSYMYMEIGIFRNPGNTSSINIQANKKQLISILDFLKAIELLSTQLPFMPLLHTILYILVANRELFQC